jgi:HEAT repeat protein
MDRVELLIETFRAPCDSSVTSKLNALMDLERLGDPRVIPFLLDLLTDEQEPEEVRLHALKRVRDGSFMNINDLREPVASAILRVVRDQSHPRLRLHAALALAEFTDVEGVPRALGTMALDRNAPLDVRYSAFTSLERAGPTPECAACLRQLLADDALGVSARTLLSLWGVGELP